MGTINANNAPTQVTPLSGVTSFLLSCFCSFFLFFGGGRWGTSQSLRMIVPKQSQRTALFSGDTYTAYA